MVGITQNRSVQDEKLIESIFQTHHTPELRASGNAIYGATSTNLIIDARPTINAVGNTAKGAGTENMDHYKDSKKAYLGIDSIHVMRDSLNKVVEALREADVLLASINSDLPDQISGISVLDRQALRRSGWLRHIQIVLEGTNLITRNIHVNSSHVLIHCSDGWDRTSQLSALAQLCLDPFYRTIRGFEILIEKDWISFGHKFMDRCGHLSSDKFFISPNDNGGGNSEANAAQAFLASMQNRFASQGHLKETSPIFHQFLECVRQIQRQYPTRFEFNERFLRQLHYHLYSCQFGTFLFNCERERRVGEDGQAPAIERTISVWDFFNSPPEMEQHLNPTYSPQLDDPSNRSSGADMGVLFPNAKDVRFWNELYGRTDEEMNGRVHVAETTASPEDENVRTPIGTPSVPTIALPPSPPSSSHLSPTSPSPRPVSPSVTASPSIPSDARPAPSRVDSFRPISSSTSAFSLRGFPASSSAGSPGLPSSPSSPKTAGSRADILNSGVKSVWGRLSSNASAAFSVVQDAYDNVAKDLRSTASSETPHEELRGRDNLAAWGEEPSFGSSGFSSNPWSRSKPEPSVASSSSVFQNPWGSSSPSDEPKPYTPPPVSEHPTDSPSSGLAAMTLETVAAAPRQQQRQPDRLPDMPLPSASNVAQPAKVAAATSAIDPLGVGFS
ncbi:unnamed protein product [Mycena citricolor]|nr:unnamed protein product [Mycena citricolor]